MEPRCRRLRERVTNLRSALYLSCARSGIWATLFFGVGDVACALGARSMPETLPERLRWHRLLDPVPPGEARPPRLPYGWGIVSSIVHGLPDALEHVFGSA